MCSCSARSPLAAPRSNTRCSQTAAVRRSRPKQRTAGVLPPPNSACPAIGAASSCSCQTGGCSSVPPRPASPHRAPPGRALGAIIERISRLPPASRCQQIAPVCPQNITTALHQYNNVSNCRHDRQCLRAKDHRSPADPAAPAQRVFPPAGFYQSPTTRTGIRPVFPAAVTRPPSNSTVSSAAPWPAPSVLAPHVPPVPPYPLKRPKRKKGPRKQTLCLFPGVFSIGGAFRSPGCVSLQFQLSLTAAPAWRLSYRPRSRWSARRSPGSPTCR